MPDDLIHSLSKNEPINWLFGRVLPKLASQGQEHFLFRVLAGGHEHAREWWNAIIREFRSVLANPELAVKKCDEELGESPAIRIADFMSEVFTVIHLSRNGYSDFAAVLAAGNKAAVDFTALKDGQRVRIEVKHLQEPQETINAVVWKRWKQYLATQPQFGLSVKHDHHGTLSLTAVSRLNNAIDQLGSFADDTYRVTLDGGISVVLERTPAKGACVIQTGVDFDDFEFDLPELHGLFVKSFRNVGASLEKFFGRQAEPGTLNVIAMHWESGKFFYSAESIKKVTNALEQAFNAVDLNLEVFIFTSPPEHDLRFRDKN
jgi:hypothetical protein